MIPLFHYTTGNKLAAILAAGQLQPSAAPPWAPDERPVLWFSASQVYEWSALKPMLKPGSTQPEYDFTALAHSAGICRFVLPGGPGLLAMQRWPHVAQRAGMGMAERMALASVGISMGANPDDWYGTFHVCPLSMVALDWLTPSGWEAVTFAEGLEHFNALGTTVASYSAHQQRITEVSQ